MPSGDISVGEVEIHPHEREVFVGGSEVALSPREFAIVLMLAEHPGWVLSAEQLCSDSVQGDYSPESVSVLVSRLRHKLALAGAPDAIETVRGAGYRLRYTRASAGLSAEATDANHELRDAAWNLQQAVIEIERSGSVEQRRDALDVLEGARRSVYKLLAD